MLTHNVLKYDIMGREKGSAAMEKKSLVNLDRLRTLMEKKGWGLTELALYSGVKYETVYSLMKARRKNPSMETLQPIAQALNTSVDYLLGNTDDDAPINEEKLPEKLRQLLELAHKLSEKRREEVVRIVATIVQLDSEEGKAYAPLLSTEDRATLLEITDEVNDDDEDGNLLDVSEAPSKKPPNGDWLFDMSPSGQGQDKPIQDQ